MNGFPFPKGTEKDDSVFKKVRIFFSEESWYQSFLCCSKYKAFFIGMQSTYAFDICYEKDYIWKICYDYTKSIWLAHVRMNQLGRKC